MLAIPLLPNSTKKGRSCLTTSHSQLRAIASTPRSGATARQRGYRQKPVIRRHVGESSFRLLIHNAQPPCSKERAFSLKRLAHISAISIFDTDLFRLPGQQWTAKYNNFLKIVKASARSFAT